MIKLRKHQKVALRQVVKAVKKRPDTTKGRIVIPTGGGKTFIETAVLEHQRKNNVQTKIHLVLAPRILLAQQLAEEFRVYDNRKNIDPDKVSYRAMAFHSGKHEPEPTKKQKFLAGEKSTTSVKEIVKAYMITQECDEHLVIFSSYHSAHKLVGFNFDTIIADESQYCTQEGFNDVIRQLKARVKLFFTATEIFTKSKNGKGLNNKHVFGKRLFYIDPKKLIALGLIVAPRLHIMHCDSLDDKRTIVDEVIELATEQHKITSKNMEFSKILFAMKGTGDVKEIENNIGKIQHALPNHTIFTITSKNGARIDNVLMKKREQFINTVTAAENCLIFHYDILSEGIDVDGITGVVLMRNMGLAKLLQTIGRAVRVYKKNPAAKKWALISVSVINGDDDNAEHVKGYINAIRYGGFEISAETIIESNPHHLGDEDPGPEDAYGDENKGNMFSSLFITNIMHELEQDLYWSKLDELDDDAAKIDMLFAA